GCRRCPNVGSVNSGQRTPPMKIHLDEVTAQILSSSEIALCTAKRNHLQKQSVRRSRNGRDFDVCSSYLHIRRQTAPHNRSIALERFRTAVVLVLDSHSEQLRFHAIRPCLAIRRSDEKNHHLDFFLIVFRQRWHNLLTLRILDSHFLVGWINLS